MRILLINPDYPTSFWSFDSVLELLGKRSHSPPLGLLTMAALLPGDWEVQLVDERIRHVREEDWEACDAVFVTGMHVQCKRILECIRTGSHRGKQVVVGGSWVFHTPEEAFEAGADIVMIGEGETAARRLVECLRASESGVTLRDHPFPELTESPTPRFDLLEMDQYLQMSVQTTRGCPFQCEFCDVTLMNGRRARTKAPAQVLAELQALYEQGWRRDVFIVDDTFNANPGKAKALLREIVAWQTERGHPFGLVTQCSVNLASNQELLDLMARGGFFRVFLGIESTDMETHALAQKFQNTKVDLQEVCTRIAEAGISVIAGCIVGYDHEPAGADQRFIEFADRTKVPDMFVTILQAPPGTDLWKRLESEGRPPWKSFADDQGGSYGLMNFEPTRPVGEIVEEFVNIYRVLYEPDAYQERTYEHFRSMRELPFRKSRRRPSRSELRALATVLWRRGVLCSSRFSFWRHVLKALWNFPRRFDRFMASLIFFEHLHRFRVTIAENLERQVAERDVARRASQARQRLLEAGSESAQVAV